MGYDYVLFYCKKDLKYLMKIFVIEMRFNLKGKLGWRRNKMIILFRLEGKWKYREMYYKDLRVC